MRGKNIKVIMMKMMENAARDFLFTILNDNLYIGSNKYARTQAVAMAGRNTEIMKYNFTTRARIMKRRK